MASTRAWLGARLQLLPHPPSADYFLFAIIIVAIIIMRDINVTSAAANKMELWYINGLYSSVLLPGFCVLTGGA